MKIVHEYRLVINAAPATSKEGLKSQDDRRLFAKRKESKSICIAPFILSTVLKRSDMD